MKRALFGIAISLAILSLTGCSLPYITSPALNPTSILVASPSPLSANPTLVASATPAIPTLDPAFILPTSTLAVIPTASPSDLVPTATVGGILPGTPSGPFGVIQVVPDDVLNIRSGPGVSNPVVGSFTATAKNVMRTGSSINIGEDRWVQVQNPIGGTGWVDALYLTEYVAPAAFCTDARVNALLTKFGNAIKTSNGGTLSSLVSPVHGMTVRLWRNGNAIVFDQAHAQWIFVSTFEHNWGAAPGSGLDTIGAIHLVVLPKWLDVLNANFNPGCDVPQAGGASYDTSWPAYYTNLNFYSLYKPGPAGNELSWRTLLIGVEYVQGQPYIFSVTQLDWEP